MPTIYSTLSNLEPTQWQLLLHGVFVGVFLLGGQLFARAPQALFRRDFWVNISTGVGIVLLLKPIMSMLASYSRFYVVNIDFLPTWLQGCVLFLCLDISRYALHYMHHRVPFFWQFHRVHHCSRSLDATSGMRMHVFDFLQLGLLPIFWGNVVFDTQNWSPWVVPSVLLVAVFFDAFQHSNMRFSITHPVGKIWHGFLNNPHFHAWHHVRDAKNCDGNYGNVLIIWDRIFKTEVTHSHLPEKMGISDDQDLELHPISLQLLKKAHSQPLP